MVEEILVVPKEVLFQKDYFKGFVYAERLNFIDIILNNCIYKKRTNKLENDNSLKQIIPYVWIINPKTKKIFVYRRSHDKKYTEKRLWNTISCGVGGHISKKDYEDPISKAMIREIKEEVIMKEYPIPKIIGYLNLDDGDAEKFHFGVIALAETEEEIKPNEGEIAEGKFMSVEEFEELLKNPDVNVESWTKVSWPFIKEYLLK